MPHSPVHDPDNPLGLPKVPSNLQPDRPFFGVAGYPSYLNPFQGIGDISVFGEFREGGRFSPESLRADAARIGGRITEEGLVPALGGEIYDYFQPLGEIPAAAGQFLFTGSGGGGGEEQEGERKLSPAGIPYEPGALTREDRRGGGALSLGGVGGQEQEVFSYSIPLPARGDEMFPAEEAPRLDRGTIEEFMQQVEATDPGEFERSSTPGNEILAAMGQALTQAGRAPTLDEALLAAGTGGTGAIAEHDARQDELAREADARRREFQRAVAEQALAGEQALIESELTAREFEQRGDQLRAQQEQRFINSMMERTSVDVSEDNVIISQPEVDEQGNPTSKVTTTVLSNKDQQEIMDSVVLGGSDPADLDLPDIAGEDIKQRMAGLSPAGKANVLLSAHVVQGTLPWNSIPLPGARETLAAIQQRARQKVMRQYGGEDVEEFNVGTLAQVSGSDVDTIADDLELIYYQELLAEMKANPALQASIWVASGNPFLASRGVQMLEELRGSGE